jgi:hypothetical protein
MIGNYNKALRPDRHALNYSDRRDLMFECSARETRGPVDEEKFPNVRYVVGCKTGFGPVDIP